MRNQQWLNHSQARALKLRIFLDDDHPFKDDPRLVEVEPIQRKLRVREPLFELPEGFEPLNQAAYRKRFGHMLPQEVEAALKLPSTSSTEILSTSKR